MISDVDQSVVLALYHLAAAHSWLAAAAVTVADDGVLLLPVSLGALWLAHGSTQPLRRRAVLAGCIAGLVAITLGLVLERTLGRPRPFVALDIAPLIPHAADSSFPSDHTLVGVALVGVLLMQLPRLGLWLFAWALVIGFARVTAGLHYPSDIVGSAALALVLDAGAWLLTVRLIPWLPGGLGLDAA